MTQPTPGLASASLFPQPITSRVCAQVHNGMGTACVYMEATMASPTPSQAKGSRGLWNMWRPPGQDTPTESLM